jgi:hypothetical protein
MLLITEIMILPLEIRKIAWNFLYEWYLYYGQHKPSEYDYMHTNDVHALIIKCLL